MKKLGLLTTLLICSLLLTGCHNPLKDIVNPIEGKSYTDVAQICEDNDGTVTTDELGNNICLFNALDWCLLETIQDGTCEFLEQDICEGDDCDIPEDSDGCKRYFDGCNRCTMQDDGDYICTEEACEQYQKPYCGDEQYNQFLEDIKSSGKQPQGKQPQMTNDYPEDTEAESILVATEKPMNTNVINLKIGDKTFDVTLEENSATKELIEKLHEGDVVVNAREYGGFEKVGDLGFDLPRTDKQITTEPGDLVLYQGNQISLFYKSNSWSYTKLGKVQMISKDGLKEILGDGNVTLVFSLLK